MKKEYQNIKKESKNYYQNKLTINSQLKNYQPKIKNYQQRKKVRLAKTKKNHLALIIVILIVINTWMS